jgi:hypothetical protein
MRACLVTIYYVIKMFQSFGLQRSNGAKCYMLSATELDIAWANVDLYWRNRSDPDSRYSRHPREMVLSGKKSPIFLIFFKLARILCKSSCEEFEFEF